jgi:peptidoglycan/LPS O-acetylase OafA/YrhL
VRGIALGLVVLFHVFGHGRVSGGVDVFLVISGFLLTRSMFRRSAAREPGRLLRHYARTALRLLPSAYTVLAFAALATWLVSGPARWVPNAKEILASALYYENWELIQSQLSYGAAGPEASPFQHFWSLSVQGQFFLLWPLVIIVAVWAARRRSWRPRRVAAVVVAALTAASFAYALAAVAGNQPEAYFNSFSRAWELSAGGLFALVQHRVRLPETLRAALCWTGLAMVAACGLVIDGSQVFPGVWALWPVAATGLVVFGTGAPGGPARLLAWRPLRVLGDISYPLYLWHWPILVFYLQYRGYGGVGLRGAVTVVGASLAVAYATQRLIGDPALKALRPLGPKRTAWVTVAALAVTGAGGFAGIGQLTGIQERELAAAAAGPTADHPGALALTDPERAAQEWGEPFIPSTYIADEDEPSVATLECRQRKGEGPGRGELKACERGQVVNPVKTVVLTGGSHSIQWYPPIELLAEWERWKIVVFSKNRCRLALGSDGFREGTDEQACREWNQVAMERIKEIKPDAVFTIGTATGDSEPPETLGQGQIDAWRELGRAGIPVIAFRDNPRYVEPRPVCIDEHGGDPGPCAGKQAERLAAVSPFDQADLPDNVVPLDFTHLFCQDGECPAVIGNVLVYRDSNHMSATYARTATTALRDALKADAPSLFD